MAFRILKQLQATESSDPSWAQRKVWVYKLDDNDSIFSYDTKAEAETKKLELENADSTGRLYQIVEI